MATAQHGSGLRLVHHGDSQATERAQTPWNGEVAWVGAAAVAGFATTALAAGWLELSRSWLVLVHAIVVGMLTFGYVRWSGIDLARVLREHWRWGVLAGVVAGALLVLAVRREDGGPRPDGAWLVWDVLWLGIVYGVLDALLLNVLPVIATFRAGARLGWTASWTGKAGVAALAIVASLLVTTAYHLGYPEFQGADVREPMIGNTIASLAYVVSSNPLGALISHIAMHVAAVFQGAEGTTQLPPHY